MKPAIRLFGVLLSVLIIFFCRPYGCPAETLPTSGLSMREVAERFEAGLNVLNTKLPARYDLVKNGNWSWSVSVPGNDYFGLRDGNFRFQVRYGRLNGASPRNRIEVNGKRKIPERRRDRMETWIAVSLFFREKDGTSEDAITAYKELAALLRDICLPALMHGNFDEHVSRVVEHFEKNRSTWSMNEMENLPSAYEPAPQSSCYWAVGSTLNPSAPDAWQWSITVSAGDVDDPEVAERFRIDPTCSPKGFRGIEWGRQFDPAEGFDPVKKGPDGAFTVYARSGDSPTEGGAELESAHYYFDRAGRFYSAELTALGQRNGNALLAEFKRNFGDIPPRDPGEYSWMFDGVLVRLHSDERGGTTASLVCWPIYKEVMEELYGKKAKTSETTDDRGNTNIK